MLDSPSRTSASHCNEDGAALVEWTNHPKTPRSMSHKLQRPVIGTRLGSNPGTRPKLSGMRMHPTMNQVSGITPG